MQDVECKINLIMFNPHEGTQFTASSMEQVEAFRDIIMQVMLLPASKRVQPSQVHIPAFCPIFKHCFDGLSVSRQSWQLMGLYRG